MSRRDPYAWCSAAEWEDEVDEARYRMMNAEDRSEDRWRRRVDELARELGCQQARYDHLVGQVAAACAVSMPSIFIKRTT